MDITMLIKHKCLFYFKTVKKVQCLQIFYLNCCISFNGCSKNFVVEIHIFLKRYEVLSKRYFWISQDEQNGFTGFHYWF